MPNIVHGITEADTPVDIDMGKGFKYVEVLYRSGSTELWAIADSGLTDSIVMADDVDVIPAACIGGSTIISSQAQGNTVVRIESTGIVGYSLKGIDQ